MKKAEMSVQYVDHMGSDLSVVNAARVSMHKESTWGRGASGTPDAGKSFLQERDTKLINYLAEHNHWTPFGHAFVTFRIKAPIFVARQLVKHQVGLVWNEVSRRYVDEEPEFWMPKEWRGRPEGSIKQGSSGVIDVDNLSDIDYILPDQAIVITLGCYSSLLEAGVAPEMARMVLPQNMMTEWIWSGSLAAWSRVVNLRLDPHAQKESQDIALMINEIMSDLFPVSWKALKGE